MPAKNIINQTAQTPIVDKNGVPTYAFFNLIEQLVNLEILEGEGNPNNILKSKKKTLYLDTSASILYVKTTDLNDLSGWVALN